jgi:hypothetical protein
MIMIYLVLMTISFILVPMTAKAEWKNVAELWKGYEITPQEKEAIKNAKLPGGATNCCGTADGIPVEWDIKDGHYWANWDGAWRQIPDDKVMRNLPVSFPVIWVTTGNKQNKTPEGNYEDAGYRDVRCFWPGAGG